MTGNDWRPFEPPDDHRTATSAPASNVRIVDATPRSPRETDRAATWLRSAMIALAFLASAAAVVSWQAQYRLVFAVKHLQAVAALEAGIPDAGALIFASLGIAMALHGRRAIRARVLNVACVGVSVGMNALAAEHGAKDLAIWIMPPVAYALASDTLIGVVRSWTIARQKALNEALNDDDATPLDMLGGLLLWLLRLAIAPRSTLSGFRRWVIEECPSSPARRHFPAAPPAPQLPAAPSPILRSATLVPARRPRRPRTTGRRSDTKTSRLFALVAERHGPLESLPLSEVSKICTALAPEVDLDPGAARSALRKHVQSLQNGHAS
jgi:hypothetical protein